MTALVHHSPTPILAGDELSVGNCAEKDLELAMKPRRALLRRSHKTHEQRFFVRDTNTDRPSELDQTDFRDIKESAIHLPATRESIQKIVRVFEALGDKCTINDPVIRYCNSSAIICFSITTPYESRKR